MKDHISNKIWNSKLQANSNKILTPSSKLWALFESGLPYESENQLFCV